MGTAWSCELEIDGALCVAAMEERLVDMAVRQCHCDCFHDSIDLLQLEFVVKGASSLRLQVVDGFPIR